MRDVVDVDELTNEVKRFLTLSLSLFVSWISVCVVSWGVSDASLGVVGRLGYPTAVDSKVIKVFCEAGMGVQCTMNVVVGATSWSLILRRS